MEAEDDQIFDLTGQKEDRSLIMCSLDIQENLYEIMKVKNHAQSKFEK